MTTLTHKERVYNNNTNKYLETKTNKVVDERYKIENLKSDIPLRNGIALNVATPDSTYENARILQYNTDRYSGIATTRDAEQFRANFSTIYSIPIRPQEKVVVPPTTNSSNYIQDVEILEKKKLIQGVKKTYNQSFGIVVGGPNSKPFGIIRNKESSFNRTTDRIRVESTPPTAVPQSQKQGASFGKISNSSNSVPFGRISNNNTTSLGLKLGHNKYNYYEVKRY